MARIARIFCAALMLILAGSALAADTPALAGNWKIIIVEGDSSRPLWLLKLDNKDGKWSGSITSAPEVVPVKVQNINVGKDVMHFSLISEKAKFACEVKVP